MPKSVAVVMSSGLAVAGQRTHFVATVSNTDAAADTLKSLAINVSPQGPVVGQPNFLTAGAAAGDGEPTIAGDGSAAFGFSIVFPSPQMPGPSPSNQPGGASPDKASRVTHPVFQVQAVGQTGDDSVFSFTLQVGVLSAVAPEESINGGQAQFGAPQNSAAIAVL
jgi:hypothetical protein